MEELLAYTSSNVCLLRFLLALNFDFSKTKSLTFCYLICYYTIIGQRNV